MTQRTFRYLAAGVGCLFVAIGISLLLAPGRQAPLFAIAPSGPAGLSTVRADLAGLFIGMGGFAVLGALTASAAFLSVPAVFLAAIATGRLVNVMADGVSAAALRSLIVEAAAFGVLTVAAMTAEATSRIRRRSLLAVPLLGLAGLGAAAGAQGPIGLMLVRRLVDQGMANQLVESLPDGLHAGLCGSGSPMPDRTRSGPCVMVIAGQRVFLVDVGDGGPRTLALMGVQPARVDGVLITHFHSDHIGGLGELMLQRWATGSHTDQTPVYGPQGVESVVEGFNLAYGLDKGYRIAHHGEATVPPSGAGGIAHPFSIVPGSDQSVTVLTDGELTITAIPVNHAPIFPAVGYRFDYKGRSLVISGDTAASPVLAKAAAGADVLFHEGLQVTMVAEMHQAAERNHRAPMAKITQDIPSYHTTPEQAAGIAAQAGVKQLVFYHMIPPLPVSYLNGAFLGDAHRAYAGPITVSRDGLLISLPARSDLITQRDLL